MTIESEVLHIKTTTGHSTLHVQGSVATALLLTSTLPQTLDDTYHTVMLNNATFVGVINIPAATGLIGREYIIYYNPIFVTGSSSVTLTAAAGGISNPITGVTTPTLVMSLAGIRSITLRSDGFNWHANDYVGPAGWARTGNSGTTAVGGGDAVFGTDNWLGTADAQDLVVGTAGVQRLRVMQPSQLGAAVVAPAGVLRVQRGGTPGTTWPSFADIGIGRYFADANARTIMTIGVSNGAGGTADTPNAVAIMGDSLGALSIGGMVDRGTAQFGRGGVGNAKLHIHGTNGSTSGPHIQATTSADNFPLFQQLNWTHDNIAMQFDGYFDGAFRNSSATSRPVIFYKLGDRLQVQSDEADPAIRTAGGATTNLVNLSFRVNGRTATGAAGGAWQGHGELFFENRVLNRRIVFLDSNTASEHEFYGLGMSTSTLRYQVSGTTAFHRFFASTGPLASTELVTIAGTGRLGILSAAPVTTLDVNGASWYGAQRAAADALVSLTANVAHFTTPTQLVAATVAAPETAIRLVRAGTTGVAFNQSVDFQVGKLTAGLGATTQFDIALGNGNIHTGNVVALTMRSDGRVIIPGTVQISGGTPGVGKVLTSDATGLASWAAAGGAGWGTTGNAGTVVGTNFVGTTDAVSLQFNVSNIEAMRIVTTTRHVNIGTNGSVTGKVGAAGVPARLNIENVTAGESCLDLYQGNNGVAVTTKMQLWNTNVTTAFFQYNNATFTGIGGGNTAVIGTSAASNSPFVIATNNAERIRVSNSGQITVVNVPTFATDALAGAGGLTVGMLYKNVAGVLSVKL